MIVNATDGSLAPRRVEELVSLVDLLPTLVELIGATLEGPLLEWTGVSLVPLLSGGRRVASPPAFAQRRPLRQGRDGGVYALQTERYKYILRLSGRDELYDLTADPLERNNLAERGGAAGDELRAALERRLDAFRQSGRPPATDEEVPEEWLQELRALGYGR